METTRNPGLLAVVVGVGLAVLFALLGITGVIDTRVGLGLATASILVPALLYLFYMRGTAITRMGYATVISILAIGLIIPMLTITQQQGQADQAATQYDLTLQRGAALFGQYCAPCHGYQGQGIIGPELNGEGGSGVPPVTKLTNDEVRRTISGGVPNPSQINTYLMPAWLDQYGGPLTEEDVSYLIALIRSSEPSYRAANNLPSTNGFDYVYGQLNTTQQATASAQASTPVKPAANTFQDLTGKKAVTVAALDDASGTTYHWSVNNGTANIIVSVGTTVTWVNNSGVAHNVYSGYGKFQPIPAPDGFKSDLLMPGAGGSFTYTFDKAGEYPYYCAIHPYMVGWITVQ